MSRQVATTPDSDFTLTIEEAVERYARAGLPVRPAAFSAMVAKGHLECRRIETALGEKYLHGRRGKRSDGLISIVRCD